MIRKDSYSPSNIHHRWVRETYLCHLLLSKRSLRSKNQLAKDKANRNPHTCRFTWAPNPPQQFSIAFFLVRLKTKTRWIKRKDLYIKGPETGHQATVPRNAGLAAQHLPLPPRHSHLRGALRAAEKLRRGAAVSLSAPSGRGVCDKRLAWTDSRPGGGERSQEHPLSQGPNKNEQN